MRRSFANLQKFSNQLKVSDAFRIEIPVGDVLAVRAKTESVSQKELLFVNPVGGAVYYSIGAAFCQPPDSHCFEVLDVNVALVDIAHSLAVRTELGKHHP